MQGGNIVWGEAGWDAMGLKGGSGGGVTKMKQGLGFQSLAGMTPSVSCGTIKVSLTS